MDEIAGQRAPPSDDALADQNLTLLEEGRRLVRAAAGNEITLRLLGGVAVLAHCPSSLERGGSRAIADVDVAVAGGQGRALSKLLTRDGYDPEARFNALHGQQRMVFTGPLGRLDVVVGTFEMCHRVDLGDRLALDDPTVTVTDLVAMKLQVVELNEKDALDVVDILRDHPLARAEGDVVNLDYLDSLVEADWGLWRTMTGTLRRLRDLSLDPSVGPKLEEIEDSLNRAPKSLRFRMRARVGERVRWYVLPDEVG